MVSVTAVTNNYIIQATLLEKHRKTLDWISATHLWKREFLFFQKLLDQHAPQFFTLEDKKKIDHFQYLLLYYNGELVDHLRKKLHEHENRLSDLLLTKNELKTEYFKEHDALMNELNSFQTSFVSYKNELFQFIEKVR
jgi:hypothetical protein